MRRRIAGVTLCATLLGTVALAQSVSYDYDRKADFSKFKTYAWVSGTNVNDELNHQRIVAAIEAQLAVKGLAAASQGESPDLLVAYYARFDRSVQISGLASGWGGPLVGGSRFGTARADQITTGTLMVVLKDARTGAIVWRGVASRDVDAGAKPERRDKNIVNAVAKMFKHYPPVD